MMLSEEPAEGVRYVGTRLDYAALDRLHGQIVEVHERVKRSIVFNKDAAPDAMALCELLLAAATIDREQFGPLIVEASEVLIQEYGYDSKRLRDEVNMVRHGTTRPLPP